MDELLQHSEFEPVSVWISGATPLKKGRRQIRELYAIPVDAGDMKAYILTCTCRELQQDRFNLDAGSELRDATGHYECVSVDSIRLTEKRVPVLTVKRLN